jgi:hypothetical protein
MSQRPGEEISPALVQLVENNLLLKQAIDNLKDLKASQEINHLVALEIRDHNTIPKADKSWETIVTVRRVLTAVAALMTALAALLGVLWATHSIWNWP